MVKVFFDTNFFLRFLLQDHQQSKQCLDLMIEVQQGNVSPYTSSIVFLELNYILTSPRLYHLSKAQAAEKLQVVLNTRNLVVIEETDFKKSLETYQQTNIKLADCIIAIQVPSNVLFCSFDRDFQKIKGLIVKTPEEILKDLTA